ncbi:MAG: AAA family ATPase [Chloroflexales bacterium]|nr:AAA family ATPase [Chloroflexales bacterium]
MPTYHQEPLTIERLPTGIAQLDIVLHGGVPRYALIFVAGLPGTGKTVFSQQIAFANARAGHTCLYLSTFAEPTLKMLRYLQGFSFFDRALFGQQVIYGDLGGALRKDGADGMLKQLDALIRTHRPELIVIDSFKALRDLIADPLAFRTFTLDLSLRLSSWEVTTLLVGEYAEPALRNEPEFATADGIMFLYGTEEAERQKRFLRVMKMRGTPFFAGEHYFEIGPDGITLFPRMAPQASAEYVLSNQRIDSSVTGLAQMLGGGLIGASTTLIGGASGTGKSLLALSFLVAHARSGTPGLLVSFEESANQIMRNAAAFGWDLGDLLANGLLSIVHVSPSELNIDRHAFDIQAQAAQIGARLVVIDSVTAFQAAVPDAARYQSYLWAITDYFKRSGITVILTTELAEADKPLQISDRQISFVADTIILLRYRETAVEISRTVTVLKMRGSSHDPSVRELHLAPPQIVVGPRLTPRESPSAHLPVGTGEG